MTTYLNIDAWSRRDTFRLFSKYADPLFNVCANVDVATLRAFIREKADLSFSIAYHFLALSAANEVESFRYRLRGEHVVVHDRIHGGTTILRDDETFTFCYFDYDPDFDRFHEGARAAIHLVRASSDTFDPKDERDDLIHFTSIPWISFTGLSHARKHFGGDSTPKIAFGKYRSTGDQLLMPVSVQVHHGLMDGLHVGRYFERLQELVADPQSSLSG